MQDKKQIYKRKVWEFLERIEPGEKFVVTSMCTPENNTLFIDCIKEYMETMPWQGNITFNHDYSKFYKQTPVPIEALKKFERTTDKSDKKEV